MLKGHDHDVSAYLRESVNLVGVVKSTCTVQLEYHTVTIIRIRRNIRL